MKNFLSVFFKEHHIDKGSSNYGGGAIYTIINVPVGGDIKYKADDKFTVNKSHSTTSEDATQLLSEIRHFTSDCGTLICGFG